MNTQMILKEYLIAEKMRGRDRQLSVDDDLLLTGIIDSIGILELLGFIEEKFGIQVPDEDVVYENFHSISAISNYLEAYQQRVAS